jgi:hypothetical protein
MLKYKNGEYEEHKARIVALGYQTAINNDKISISSQPSRQLHRMLQYVW